MEAYEAAEPTLERMGLSAADVVKEALKQLSTHSEPNEAIAELGYHGPKAGDRK